MTQDTALPLRSSQLCRLLDQCLEHGADQAEAMATQNVGLVLSSRMGKLESVEHVYDKGLRLTVYKDHRSGTVSTTDLSEKSLLRAVRGALSIATYTEPDSCAGLADAQYMAQSFSDLQLYHPLEFTQQELVERVIGCEEAALAHSHIHNSQGASLSTQNGCVVYANSHGFVGHQQGSMYSLSCAPIASSGDEMRTDYEYVCARKPCVLELGMDLGKKAAERSARSLNPRTITSRKAPVVFESRVASSLIRHLISAITGSNLYKKTSYLLDAVGSKVMAEHLSLGEYPKIKGGLSSADFDDEGVATSERVIVDQGVLRGYVLNSYSARRLKLQTTANAGGTHNPTLSSSQSQDSLPALLQEMGTGLLVTELSGFGVNLTTGDYSRGAAGFWIEGGEIAHPVDKILIAGTLPTLFQSIVAIAKDVDASSSIRSGSIWVEQMTIAGV